MEEGQDTKEIIRELTVIGEPRQNRVKNYLANTDPCFGKFFSKNADECGNCNLTVVSNGKLYFLHELCAEVTTGVKEPAPILRLTSQQVLDRVARGEDPCDIVWEVAGEDAGAAEIAEARTLVANRFAYLKRKQLPIPDLPTTQEILDGKE